MNRTARCEVLIFKDKAMLARFVDKGWEFGGGGTDAAAAGGKGAKAEQTEISSGPIAVYPMTKTGLAIGVAAGARKYLKDEDLSK